MDGKVNVEGTDFQWWAGPADPDVGPDYCVHCRKDQFGITRYLTSEPDREQAESAARELAPMVQKLG